MYGGLELPPADTMYTIETLAQADGSAAWCVFIGATSGTRARAAAAPTRRARSSTTPEVLLGGVFAPRGKAIAEPGGFRVNGRWQWGSGTQNARLGDGRLRGDPRRQAASCCTTARRARA